MKTIKKHCSPTGSRQLAFLKPKWRSSLSVFFPLCLITAALQSQCTAGDNADPGGNQTNRLQVVSIQLGSTNVEQGIHLRDSKDGHTSATNIAGWDCREGIQRIEDVTSYMYFALDRSFKSGGLMEQMEVLVIVEYFDAAPGYFFLEYDSNDPKASQRGAYTRAQETEKLTGSKKWKKAYAILKNARFRNSQNGGSDFRIDLRAPRLFIRRVTVVRLDDLGSEPLAAPDSQLQWQR